jgi:hypothetical protein
MPLKPNMKVTLYVLTSSPTKDMNGVKSVKIGEYARRGIMVGRPRIWWGLEGFWMQENMK